MENKKSKYPKLPKDFKDKWLKALRSGEYKQGKNYLLLKEKENKYCCLGVACKVANYEDKYLDSEFIPHQRLKRVLSILHGQSFIAGRLSNMNDKGKKSFKFIADWIDKNL